MRLGELVLFKKLKAVVVAAALAGSGLSTGAAYAAIQTITVEGTYLSTTGLDMGTVSGQFTYDDANDIGSPGPQGAFAPTSLTLTLSGGLSISFADDPLAQIVTTRSTGEFSGLEIFATGLSGFGLSNLGFVTESDGLSFFIFDATSAVVFEGQFAAVDDLTPVPLPSVGLAVPIIAFLAFRRRLNQRG